MLSFYLSVVSYLEGSYSLHISSLCLLLGLISLSPLTVEGVEGCSTKDKLLALTRRLAIAYIFMVGTAVLVIVKYGSGLLLNSNKGMVELAANLAYKSLINTLAMLTVAYLIGLILRTIHRRYLVTRMSSFMRRYRYNVSGDKESDIRDLMGSLSVKDYLPSDYYNFELGIFIGLNENDIPQYISLTKFLEVHTEILGPTRTGKGVLMGSIAEQLIMIGNSLLFHDPKGDKFMPHILKETADKLGVKFIYFDLNDNGPGQWSPFEGGLQREQRIRLMWTLGMKETGSDGDFYKLGEKQIIDTFLAGNKWSIKRLFTQMTKLSEDDDHFKKIVLKLKELEPLTTGTSSGQILLQLLEKKQGKESTACLALKKIFNKDTSKANVKTKNSFRDWILLLSGNDSLCRAIKSLSVFKSENDELSFDGIIRLLRSPGGDHETLANEIFLMKEKLKTSGWTIDELMNMLLGPDEEGEAKRALSSLNELAQISTFTPEKGYGFDWEELLMSKEPFVVYIKGNLDDDVIRKMHRLLIIHLGQLMIRLEKENKRHSHITEFVDEVAFLTSLELSNNLSTIAGFRCNMILAYQGASQLKFIDDKSIDADAVEESIHINCQNKVIYRIDDPKNAEWAAGTTGTKLLTVKRLENSTVDEVGAETWAGEGSYNRVEEAYIHENVFKSLSNRTGVLISPGQLASIIFTAFVPVKMNTNFNTLITIPEKEGVINEFFIHENNPVGKEPEEVIGDNEIVKEDNKEITWDVEDKEDIFGDIDWGNDNL